jgi:hypothetical protein
MGKTEGEMEAWIDERLKGLERKEVMWSGRGSFRRISTVFSAIRKVASISISLFLSM